MECSLCKLEAEMFARIIQRAAISLALVTGGQVYAAPLTYGTYYDEKVSTFCDSSSAFCRLNFSQLPPDRLLMVRKINCSISSSLPIAQVILQISATSGGPSVSTRTLPLATPPSQLISGVYFTNFREDTSFLIGQARYPFVVAGAQGGNDVSGFSCTLIGDLVTPIQ